jgi:hypothetical protein
LGSAWVCVWGCCFAVVFLFWFSLYLLLLLLFVLWYFFEAFCFIFLLYPPRCLFVMAGFLYNCAWEFILIYILLP